MADSQFNFTWGLDNLKDMGFVPLYQFMLRAYAELGITRQEMLCLIHLASYHYNSPAGESRPSLDSIATQMGYTHKPRVSELVTKLEAKGMLLVERRPGLTSIYNARPFAEKAYKLWLRTQNQAVNGEEATPAGVTKKRNTPKSSITQNRNPQDVGVTQDSNGGLLKLVTEEEEIRTKVNDKKMDSSSDLWPLALADLALQMAPETFNQHLCGTTATVAQDNGATLLTVHARGDRSADQLDRRLRPVVERTLARVAGGPVAVTFTKETKQ
jgi:hypothetical protein